jgi:hypothetical protein
VATPNIPTPIRALSTTRLPAGTMNGCGRRLATLLRFLAAENKGRFVIDVYEGRAQKYHYSLYVKGRTKGFRGELAQTCYFT